MFKTVEEYDSLSTSDIIKDFKDFVESKAGETFEYLSNNNCAFAQYLKDRLGWEDVWVGGWTWARAIDHREIPMKIPMKIQEALLESKTAGEFSRIAHFL